MIAQLAAPVALTRLYRTFLDSLRAQGFKGDIAPDYANRTVLATDNSIYQRLPQAALFPRDVHDIQVLTRLVAQEEFRQIGLPPPS
ncbi:hypothetical protein [Pseudomonas protegens]|uniref:hypothetical protein n=1 Tax=Pseudomonas protegens TaxID=380021 RepID=UPI001F36DFFC|nr:hypothetical protein [Pseudomonas protegens]